MSHSRIHAAAERHRWVATALTNPNDRAIIGSFADEVDSLARFELRLPDQPRAGRAGKSREMGDILTKAFPREYTSRFDNLLRALNHQ